MIGFILGRIFFFFFSLFASIVGVDGDGVIEVLVTSVAVSIWVGCEVFADLGVRSKTSMSASCGCFIGLICGVAVIDVSTSLVDPGGTLFSVGDHPFSSSS
jgi:hypothetical protein